MTLLDLQLFKGSPVNWSIWLQRLLEGLDVSHILSNIDEIVIDFQLLKDRE
jgi:hypothetical protein